MNKEEMIEKLSDIEHDRWRNWQRYLHSCCIKNEDGSLTIPKILVERWEYEINTKYNNLPDNIKESDRKETYKIIPIIEEYLQRQIEEKSKIINDTINYIKNSGRKVLIEIDEILEILERGKNVNTTN